MTQIRAHAIRYELDGQAFEGQLVYDPSVQDPRPGLVMAPNWFGITETAVETARQVAEERRVVLVADLYGAEVRPKDAEAAAAAMQPLKEDRALLRRRMQAALQVLLEQHAVAIDPQRLAAFGFCFGGTCALELGRAGAELKAFISFHGALDTPDPADARHIKGAVLVLDGASDPLVPRTQLPAFAEEMSAAGVDWQLLSYGGAVHSFTDPEANRPGVAQYNPKVARRAFAAMDALLDEVFL